MHGYQQRRAIQRVTGKHRTTQDMHRTHIFAKFEHHALLRIGGEITRDDLDQRMSKHGHMSMDTVYELRVVPRHTRLVSSATSMPSHRRPSPLSPPLT